jgi:CheY-like chemotaxis protein
MTSPRQAPLNPPLVLVADDDADLREAIGATLEDVGCEVLLAENGAVALEIMRNRLPDVIILDLMMPVVDGVQFRKLQLSDSSLARVPVVVLSGHGQGPKQLTGLNIDAYCEKPISSIDLLDILRRYVPIGPRDRRGDVRPT